MPLFNRQISLRERDIKMDDRRSNGRTRISKAASLFFGGQTGAPSCDVNLTDLTNGGAGIYKKGLAVLPVTFELSFDNLRRKCRLVWRKGNFFGVAFENQSLPSDRENELGEGDIAIPEPAFSILNDPPPQPAYFGNADLLPECTTKGVDRKHDGRADLRFAIGVAVAFALPVLISISAYVATTVVLKVN
jgi:hypothetical protein